MSRSHHWIAALPLLLGGCLSLHSNQPRQQTYVLSLPPAPTVAAAPAVASATPTDAQSTDAAGASLQVLLPVAAAGLGGDGIAVLRLGQRLDYFSGARWAENAPTLVQGLLIGALRRQGKFAFVESDSGVFTANYVLSVDLTHFEASYVTDGTEQAAPTARVELVCTLGRRGSGSAVMTLTVSGAVAAQSNRMQAVVVAFQRATEQVLSRLAQQLTVPSTP